MAILVDSHVKNKESHLRDLMCYKSQLVASQHFIKQYVRKRVYNYTDVFDVVQEINQVALEKESTYKKDYTFVGIDPSKCKLSSSYGGTSWIIPDKSCKDPNGVNAVPQVMIFRKWISGICRFQVLAFLKKEKRNRIDYMEDIYGVYNPSDMSRIPSVEAIKKELSAEFDNHLLILSKREREVVSLLRLGYKQADIARKLSINPCHVSVYKKKGIIKIKSSYALAED